MMTEISSYSNVELIQKPKAEEEIAVAAASILARSERDKIIEDLSNEFSCDLKSLTPTKVLSLPFAKEIAKLSYIQK